MRAPTPDRSPRRSRSPAIPPSWPTSRLGKGPRQTLPVLGYAGWAPGQLESELAQGSWFTIPADPALVFAPDPTRAWEAAFARRGVDL